MVAPAQLVGLSEFVLVRACKNEERLLSRLMFMYFPVYVFQICIRQNLHVLLTILLNSFIVTLARVLSTGTYIVLRRSSTFSRSRHGGKKRKEKIP